MDSSKHSKCLVRGQPVLLTPEEVVRQKLLYQMLFELGYPLALVSVEKKVGTRRYDIVSYDRTMAPLLLIECKADQITGETLSQALGYNGVLAAPFICLAGANEIKTIWQGGSAPFLPRYEELHAKVRRG